MFKMKSKVRILIDQKEDGRYNTGTVMGIELVEHGMYLGYVDEKEFLKRFVVWNYKVAYIDCITKRACTQCFLGSELCGKK